MSDAKVIMMEYGGIIYQCPTEPEGWMCDLWEPCDFCPLVKENEEDE